MVDATEMGTGLKRRQQAAGRRRRKTKIPFLLLLAILLMPRSALSFCHEMEVVQTRFFRVAASIPGPVWIEWFGHSTFQITSSKGTRILTDPHTRDDLP